MSSDEETPLLIDENQCNENNVGSEPLADITTKPGVNDVARKSNADLSTPQVHEYPNGHNHNAQLNDLQPEQAANIAPQSIRRRRALSLDYDISRKEHRLLPNTPNHNNNENHQKDKSRTTPHKHRYSRKKNAIINGKCTRQSLFLPKSQTIRFPSNINEKKYVLTLTVPKHQFYNLKLSRVDDGLQFRFPSSYPPPIHLPDIKFEQLLYWPGVSLLINVEHVQVEHKLHPNIQRQIVFDADPLIQLPTEANSSETKHILNNVPVEKRSLFSKQALCDYMPALLAAGSIYDIPASRLNELKAAFDVIKTDLVSVPFEEIELKSIHTMFSNKHRYVRWFPTDPTDSEPTTMREIINPEVNFSFQKCTFTTCASWTSEMDQYLEEMFVTRSKKFSNTLRDRLKKCITLRCDYCYSTYDGPLASFSLTAHMKEKHYFAKDWTCISCRQSWPHIELLSMKWQHDCENTTQQNGSA